MNDKPYKPKQKNEISYFVNARQKTYLKSTEIYIPNNPYEKLEDGYELSESKPKQTSPPISTPEEEKQERSTRRARIVVKDIVLSNSFELFVTFTFRSNRFDADKCRQRLNGWLKRHRKINKTFQYVVVPELHKKCEACTEDKIKLCVHEERTKALHFHTLMQGYTGEVVRSINPKTGKPLVKGRRKVFDFPTYTLGHCDVYKVGGTDDDKIRMGFYILKYIRKEMPSFKNKKRYWSSRRLRDPLTIENPEEWYLTITPDHLIETEYGKFLFFDNQRIEIFLP